MSDPVPEHEAIRVAFEQELDVAFKRESAYAEHIFEAGFRAGRTYEGDKDFADAVGEIASLRAALRAYEEPISDEEAAAAAESWWNALDQERWDALPKDIQVRELNDMRHALEAARNARNQLTGKEAK